MRVTFIIMALAAACGGGGNGGSDAAVQSDAAPDAAPPSLVVSDDIVTDTTWGGADCPVLVTREISVGATNGATLRVFAGCTVEFAPGAGLRVGEANAGALVAMGTATNKIAFTASAGTTPGSWKGLLIGAQADGSALRYVDVGYGGGGYLGSIESHLAAAPIADTRVHDGGSDGFHLVASGFASGTGGVGLEATGNAGYGLAMEPEYFSSAGPGMFTGNATGAVFVSAGTIATTGNWANPGAPITIGGDVTISAPGLGVAAGTELRFAAGASIVGNSISLGGTASAPILLTSAAASPARGDWEGVRASSGTFSYVTVEYAGGTGSGSFGECIDALSVSLVNVTARHCLGFGIHAAQILGSTGPLFASDNSAGALRTRITYIPSIPAGSVLEGAIEIDPFDGTSIFTDTRWKNWGGPYRIPLDMQIYNNAIWTLDPGVTLAFAPAAGVQMGAARLDAIGTAAAPIRFTSYGTPTPGAWDGILFLDASFNNSQLTNVVVEGASHAIETFKAAPVVSNALLQRSNTGIYVHCGQMETPLPGTAVSYGAGADANLVDSFTDESGCSYP